MDSDSISIRSILKGSISSSSCSIVCCILYCFYAVFVIGTKADSVDSGGGFTVASSAGETLQLRHPFEYQETQHFGDSNGDDKQSKNSGSHNKSVRYQPPQHLRHQTQSHNQRHLSLPASASELPLRHQQLQQQQHQRHSYAASDVVTVAAKTSPPLPAPATTAAPSAAVAGVANDQNKISKALSFNANSSFKFNSISSATSRVTMYRYFDRDGKYPATIGWTTRGPRMRAVGRNNAAPSNGQRISLNLYANENLNEFPAQVSANYDNPAYDDDNDYDENDDDNGENNKSIFEDEHTVEIDSNVRSIFDAPNNDGDYLYDDAVEFPNTSPNFQSKANVAEQWKEVRVHKKRDYLPFGRQDGSLIDDDSTSIADENNDANFSSERWQKIEQEHYRKKKEERQRKMMELRAQSNFGFASATTIAKATPTTDVAVPASVNTQRSNDDDVIGLITLADDTAHSDEKKQF